MVNNYLTDGCGSDGSFYFTSQLFVLKATY